MRKAIEAAAEGIYMMSPWRKNTYDNQTYSWADIAEDHETFIEEATAAIDAAAPILAEAHEPRTITTIEELHGLPLGSVIIDSDPCVLQMLEKSAIGGAEWAQPNEERIYSSGHVTLPATVLYEPTA